MKVALIVVLVILSAVLAVELEVEIWLYLLVVTPLSIGWFIYWDWHNESKWKEITHVPKWVIRKAKLISKEYASRPNPEAENNIAHLSGTWFVYKLSFSSCDGELIKIYRKRKKIKQRGGLNGPLKYLT